MSVETLTIRWDPARKVVTVQDVEFTLLEFLTRLSITRKDCKQAFKPLQQKKKAKKKGADLADPLPAGSTSVAERGADLRDTELPPPVVPVQLRWVIQERVRWAIIQVIRETGSDGINPYTLWEQVVTALCGPESELEKAVTATHAFFQDVH